MPVPERFTIVGSKGPPNQALQQTVQITVQTPITLSFVDKVEDPEAMFRFLNDLMSNVSSEINKQAKVRFKEMEQQVTEAGIILNIPDLTYPMGVGYEIGDVTGHVGKKWSEKK